MNSLFKAITLILISALPLQYCVNTNGNRKAENLNNDSALALLEAVSDGDTNLVTEILGADPDLEITDGYGRTPLMIATYNADNKIAEMLIAAGSNVNAQDKKMNTPFLYAGASGNLPILKMSIANGADFDIYNRYGGTALIPAAEKGHLEAVKLLTEIPDYPIDHINILGWTALLEAIILSEEGETQIAIVRTLVEAGSDVNIPDKDGITPLEHAKNRSMDKIVGILSKTAANN
jgi:hypothetical protein